MATKRRTVDPDLSDDPVPPAAPDTSVVLAAAPLPSPLIGTAPEVMTPAWLMGIGKVDNIKPPNPPGLAGHYVGICNHGSESEAEHATRLGASAGTATDIGWMLGTIKDAVCAGETPPVIAFCSPTGFEVVTQPTGATNKLYYNVPTTGGSGTTLTLTISVENGAVTGEGISLGSAGMVYDEVTKYQAGDVVTIAAGQLGAGSSAMTIKITAMTCYDKGGNVIGGGGGGGTQICEIETFSMLAAPTGAVDGMYTNVPFTGGAGSSDPAFKFTVVRVTGGAVNASASDLLAEHPADFAGVYKVGDVLTVAAGKVGAGSSGWTVRVETVYCYMPGQGGGGGS